MAWPDFSLSDAYTTIITKLNTGFTNVGKLFRDQTTGDYANQVRYNSSAKRFEYWTGSAWSPLDISLSTIANAEKVGGNLPAAFATAAQGAKADSALPLASYTASDVLAKLLTVDGAGSGIDAAALGGHAVSYFQVANAQSAKSVFCRSEDNLRIIRGSVTDAGAVGLGAGFTVSKTGTGDYVVTFSNNFATAPTVLCTLITTVGGRVVHEASSVSSVTIHTFNAAGFPDNQAFDLIAIGPN